MTNHPLPWKAVAPFNGCYSRIQWHIEDNEEVVICECEGEDEGGREAMVIVLIANRSGDHLCALCGSPAVCFGNYEEEYQPIYACSDCCEHDNYVCGSLGEEEIDPETCLYGRVQIEINTLSRTLRPMKNGCRDYILDYLECTRACYPGPMYDRVRKFAFTDEQDERYGICNRGMRRLGFRSAEDFEEYLQKTPDDQICQRLDEAIVSLKSDFVKAGPSPMDHPLPWRVRGPWIDRDGKKRPYAVCDANGCLIAECGGEDEGHHEAVEIVVAINLTGPKVCDDCGKPATCFGSYEIDLNPSFACSECCGHGCEDGECVLIEKIFSGYEAPKKEEVPVLTGKAYFSGRVERFEKGEGVVHQYDISSSYPEAMKREAPVPVETTPTIIFDHRGLVTVDESSVDMAVTRSLCEVACAVARCNLDESNVFLVPMPDTVEGREALVLNVRRLFREQSHRIYPAKKNSETVFIRTKNRERTEIFSSSTTGITVIAEDFNQKKTTLLKYLLTMRASYANPVLTEPPWSEDERKDLMIRAGKLMGFASLIEYLAWGLSIDIPDEVKVARYDSALEDMKTMAEEKPEP